MHQLKKHQLTDIYSYTLGSRSLWEHINTAPVDIHTVHGQILGSGTYLSSCTCSQLPYRESTFMTQKNAARTWKKKKKKSHTFAFNWNQNCFVSGKPLLASNIFCLQELCHGLYGKTQFSQETLCNCHLTQIPKYLQNKGLIRGNESQEK